MPQKPLDPDKRKGIQAALLADTGVNETARLFKCDKATVSRIASSMGVDAQQAAVKKAQVAGALYAKERRLQLSNTLFQKLEQLLAGVEPNDSFKDLVMAFAILTDKRRLEEGEATERREYNDPAAIAARGRERLALLGRTGS